MDADNLIVESIIEGDEEAAAVAFDRLDDLNDSSHHVEITHGELVSPAYVKLRGAQKYMYDGVSEVVESSNERSDSLRSSTAIVDNTAVKHNLLPIASLHVVHRFESA